MPLTELNSLKIGERTADISSISSLILVRPGVNIGYQPQARPSKYGDVPPNPPKFLFNQEGENIAESSSEITDHYVENNTAIQDHIALKPLMISVQGFVGELISDQLDFAPGLDEGLNYIEGKLTPLSQYAPDFTNDVLRFRNTATRIAQTTELIKDTVENVKEGLNSTQQQDAFNLFYSYQQNRILFTVQTPWAVFTDMALENIRTIQNDETRFMTSFELSFKQMNFVRTSKIEPDSSVSEFDGRSLAQSRPELETGQSIPTTELSFNDALGGFSA